MGRIWINASAKEVICWLMAIMEMACWSQGQRYVLEPRPTQKADYGRRQQSTEMGGVPGHKGCRAVGLPDILIQKFNPEVLNNNQTRWSFTCPR